MQLSHRELWTAVHGMVLGAGFLILFSAGFAGLWMMRSRWITDEGADKITRRLIYITWAMAILAWLGVGVGTYVIYPWYRAKPPAGTSAAEMVNYPKYLLISRPGNAELHELGMEWKEHVAWFCPMLATAVAFVVTCYGRQIARDHLARRMLLFLYAAAFFSAGVAGLFGALINKAAPTR
jgi:hypothetical protein